MIVLIILILIMVYQPDDYRGNGDVLVVTKVSELMLPGWKISHDIFDIFLFQML